MSHLDHLRARFHLGADAPDPIDVIPLPESPPVAGLLAPPSIRGPLVVRRQLADWFYRVTFHAGAWGPREHAAYRAILSTPIDYVGPRGWDEQPGWVMLYENTGEVLARAGVSGDVIRRWSSLIESSWLPSWAEEWSAAGYGDRVGIGKAWQSAYVDGIKEWAAQKVEDAAEAAKRAIDDNGLSIGAGLAIGAAVVGVVGLSLAFPEATIATGQRAYQGWTAQLASSGRKR